MAGPLPMMHSLFKYASPLLGLAILMASVVTAAAADEESFSVFVCEPNLTVVQVFDGGEMRCTKTQKQESCSAIRAYVTNSRESSKRYPPTSPLFRYEPGEQDELYYRGRRCVGPFSP